jgi:hypothetical protein
VARFVTPHYNYFRDYDPAVGRFVEPDPIGLFGGTNTFVYTYQNPISRFDIRGLYRSSLNHQSLENLLQVPVVAAQKAGLRRLQTTIGLASRAHAWSMILATAHAVKAGCTAISGFSTTWRARAWIFRE